MRYYFHKIIQETNFKSAVENVYDELKEQGFGVLNEINLTEIFKNKLGVDFRNYKILSACNPEFAHRAVWAENKIGLLLPCNVVVQELANGTIEVSAIDPVISMRAVDNETLAEIANEVQKRLKQVIDNVL